MSMKILYLLHVLATVVWVGGMFFAHQCLRPAAVAQLEPPLRLKLWRAVFGRFLPWVWLCVILLVASGLLLIRQMGGMAAVPVHVHVMAAIGYLMCAIFIYLFFLPYARLRHAVASEDWAAAGAALDGLLAAAAGGGGPRRALLRRTGRWTSSAQQFGGAAGGDDLAAAWARRRRRAPAGRPGRRSRWPRASARARATPR